MLLTRIFSLITFLVLLTTAGALTAQGLAGERNLDKGILLNFGYGAVVPAGDLAERFGNGFSVEVAVDYTGKESPWIFGVMGQYIFGNDVKEDVLTGIRLRSGVVVGNQRAAADLQLRMRGYFAGVRVARILAFGDNPRAGLKLGLGLGWLSHRIRIQNDVNQSVPQLFEDYRKGYDRLTAGPALYNFVGYHQQSRNGRVNFYVGGELFTGFTASRRDFDFPTAGSLEGGRLDLLGGVRAGLILPLYVGEGREIFYR